jgi:hypothetical protein
MIDGKLKDREIAQPEEWRGSLAKASRGYTKSQLWQDKVQGDATFQDLIILLGMAVKGAVAPTTPAVGPAPTARLWTYAPTLTAVNTPDTYTVEFGDEAQAYEAEYVFATSLELAGAMNEPVKVSADITGRRLSTSTFTPALADRTVESALAQKTVLSLDDAGGVIGTTAVSGTVFGWKWTLPEHFVPKRQMDGQLYFSSVTEKRMQPKLELTCEFNSTFAAVRAKYAADTAQLARLDVLGSLIAATEFRRLRIDGAYRITEIDKLDESDGTTVVGMTLLGEYDATFAKLFELSVENTLTALP